MWRNESMRNAKYDFTYNTVPKDLGEYPEPLNGHEKTLRAILSFMTGASILLNTSGWQINKSNSLFVIDWEFAQFGHRSCDLGQLLGDLYERHVYGNYEIALVMMNGVIEGYGKVTDEMASRTAIYVGMHLISWYIRKGQRVVSPGLVTSGLTIGRDFMMKGWGKDAAFFQNSMLASLFTTM